MLTEPATRSRSAEREGGTCHAESFPKQTMERENAHVRYATERKPTRLLIFLRNLFELLNYGM